VFGLGISEPSTVWACMVSMIFNGKVTCLALSMSMAMAQMNFRCHQGCPGLESLEPTQLPSFPVEDIHLPTTLGTPKDAPESSVWQLHQYF